jgi:hypothetical protein
MHVTDSDVRTILGQIIIIASPISSLQENSSSMNATAAA